MFLTKLEDAKMGYTYDDVLLVPGPSRVEPIGVNVESSLTRHIKLNIPVVSSPMDTVSESEMAIALARLGGIGIIHRNNKKEVQVEMIKRVKREEALIIKDLYTVSPDTSIHDAIKLMREKRIAGLPVILDNKLVGILTNRDIRFLKGNAQKVMDVMTKQVITGNINLSMEQALDIMNQKKIEKLPLVDGSGNLVGLITAKDILKREQDPLAVRDEEGKK
ncbi:MAG: IMP dehydrogenase [Candidatus Thermoplasmatota archaeon]|nr:IMP dehydrogenase [Candidatus Thermoplasmatota archaeon]